MRKVLVTGASGFLGRPVVQNLYDRGFEVHAVSRKKVHAEKTNAIWHEADLKSRDSVHQLMDKVQPTHLIHLAWEVTPKLYWTSLENFSWVSASLEILRAFHRVQGKRFVGVGTSAEYDWRYGFLSENLTPTIPSTTYGTCKFALQQMVESFGRDAGLSTAWGRLFSIYGPGEKPERLIPSAIRSLSQDESPFCPNGNETLQFLHIDEAADALVTLLESEVRGPVNIADPFSLTLGDMLKRLASHVGKSELIRLGGQSPSNHYPNVLIGDTRRLTEELGWKPKRSLSEGLRQTIEWWQNEGQKEGLPVSRITDRESEVVL